MPGACPEGRDVPTLTTPAVTSLWIVPRGDDDDDDDDGGGDDDDDDDVGYFPTTTTTRTTSAWASVRSPRRFPPCGNLHLNIRRARAACPHSVARRHAIASAIAIHNDNLGSPQVVARAISSLESSQRQCPDCSSASRTILRGDLCRISQISILS
ncbi:hypothetical protein HN011_007753 [Eciton burchellii]|nr:hypothetical protein HN011_007753 [Eciton burchellii]